MTSDEILDQAAGQQWSHTPPRRQEVADWIEALILTGRIQVGERLPSERLLAAALRISRVTLRRAFALLQHAGILIPTRGRNGGSIVSDRFADIDLSDLSGLSAQLRRVGRTVTSRVVHVGIVEPNPKVVQALAMDPDDMAYEVVRIRLADGEPVVLEDTFLAMNRFAGLLLRHDLDGSVYRLMDRGYHQAPTFALQLLAATMGTPEERHLLNMPDGLPLLRIVRTSWNASGKPVEYSDDRFRTDRLTLMVPGMVDRDSRGDRPS